MDKALAINPHYATVYGVAPIHGAVFRFDKSLASCGMSLARRRHLSQQDLAERIGVSVITIRRMEAGHPSVAFVNRKAPQKQERFDGLVSSSHWPIPNKMHGGDV